MKSYSDQPSSLEGAVLPPIHIMAGGIHSLPYARFAAECLWHHCPGELRQQLKVVIGLCAIPERLLADAVRFVSLGSWVSVLYDTVKLPLWAYHLPKKKTRHRLSRGFCEIRKLLDRLKVPPRMQIRLAPMVNDNLGNYYHEFFVRICDLEQNRALVCILDADFFVSDTRFFQELAKPPAANILASAWIRRWDDGLTAGDKTYYPVGSECVLLQPKLFNQFNWQVETMGKVVLDRMRKKYPGIKFQREMVDTAYQACWEAQMAGYGVNYPFREMNVCHVGGFGHSNVSYIKECLQQPMDETNGAPFWVRRIRLNQRVAKELAARYSEPWITAGLGHVQERAEAAWMVPEIRRLRDETPQSDDEVLFEKIASAMAR